MIAPAAPDEIGLELGTALRALHRRLRDQLSALPAFDELPPRVPGGQNEQGESPTRRPGGGG